MTFCRYTRSGCCCFGVFFFCLFVCFVVFFFVLFCFGGCLFVFVFVVFFFRGGGCLGFVCSFFVCVVIFLLYCVKVKVYILVTFFKLKTVLSSGFDSTRPQKIIQTCGGRERSGRQYRVLCLTPIGFETHNRSTFYQSNFPFTRCSGIIRFLLLARLFLIH